MSEIQISPYELPLKGDINYMTDILNNMYGSHSFSLTAVSLFDIHIIYINNNIAIQIKMSS